MTTDGAGNLVIADTGNNRVRVVAARTGTFYGQAMTAGDIYTDRREGTRAARGGAPTQGVAVDAAGKPDHRRR